MAAQDAMRERDERLADRIGRRVVYELAKWMNTGQIESD